MLRTACHTREWLYVALVLLFLHQQLLLTYFRHAGKQWCNEVLGTHNSTTFTCMASCTSGRFPALEKAPGHLHWAYKVPVNALYTFIIMLYTLAVVYLGFVLP